LKLVDGLLSASQLNPPRRQRIREAYYDVAWDRLRPAFAELWKQSNKDSCMMLSARNRFVMEEFQKESEEFRQELSDIVDAKDREEKEKWEKKMEAIGADNVNGEK
jgi:hypothetical protein